MIVCNRRDPIRRAVGEHPLHGLEHDRVDHDYVEAHAVGFDELLKDPKTRLQEFLQSRSCELPRYEVVDIQGEPHCRTFFVECEVVLLNEKSRGQGVSRRIAEQVAAAAALIALGVENGND